MIRPALPDHVGDPVSSPSVVNVPNGLTVLRLLLVPVFAWLLLRDSGDDSASRVWAAVVFAVAGATTMTLAFLAASMCWNQPPLACQALWSSSTGACETAANVRGITKRWAASVVTTSG